MFEFQAGEANWIWHPIRLQDKTTCLEFAVLVHVGGYSRQDIDCGNSIDRNCAGKITTADFIVQV